MAADYWLAAIPLDVDPSWRPHPWTSACGWRQGRLTSTGNDPQKTMELFSFGRLEEEKLKFHHHPRRERVNVVNRRPLHHQRESGGVRQRPRDPVTERKRTVYNSLLAITVGHASATVVLLRPGRRQAVLPPIQDRPSSVYNLLLGDSLSGKSG
ncbi:hypothetical protein Taro_009771 [Colocasia esculenta]|uniref:Uncharacterized protein n=1 Tax=Colocasia esculenta TaxID=4460 RepID=A0A843TX86_COLES|nr:hypothetical protein [Colocasia esculenta]